MAVIASDVAALTLATVNISAGSLNKADGGTVAGDVTMTGALILKSPDNHIFNGGSLEAVSGGQILIDGGAFFEVDSGGFFTVDTGATCTLNTATVPSSGNLTIASGGTLSVAGTESLTGVLLVAANGRIRHNFITGADSDHTYYITDADRINVTTLTSNRVYTLGDTNAGAGDEIEICVFNQTSANIVTVKDATATTLNTLKHNGGAGEIFWAKFVHNGTHFVNWSYVQF
jgi:hypothetical protein